MEGQTCFRRARLDRGLTVEEVARRTHLRPAHVALIDDGRLAELPAGLYARAYLRAYAVAVGLDPEAVIARFADDLPRAPDPIPALREVARERMAPTIGMLVLDWIRSTMAERAARTEPVGRPAGESLGIRAAAACIDAALLALINLTVALLIAASCGVSLDVLLRQAGAAVAVVWTFTSATYFVLLAGVGGRTAGAHVCSLRPEPRDSLRLRCILLRAARTAMSEASIVVNWMIMSPGLNLPASGFRIHGSQGPSLKPEA